MLHHLAVASYQQRQQQLNFEQPRVLHAEEELKERSNVVIEDPRYPGMTEGEGILIFGKAPKEGEEQDLVVQHAGRGSRNHSTADANQITKG